MLPAPVMRVRGDDKHEMLPKEKNGVKVQRRKKGKKTLFWDPPQSLHRPIFF